MLVPTFIAIRNLLAVDWRDRLEGILSNTPKTAIVIILGDLNAKIEKNNYGVQSMM